MQDGVGVRAREPVVPLGHAVLLLALAAGLYAVVRDDGPPPVPQAFDRYINLGPQAGTLSLRQDLVRDHPAGSDLGSLLMRLTGAGFDCRQDQRPNIVLVCQLRRALDGGRIGTVDVAVRNNGVTVEGIDGQVALARC